MGACNIRYPSQYPQSINQNGDITSQIDPNYTTYVHNPPFADVVAANLNGSTDGYEEVIGLRQFPGHHPERPFLVMLNPNNEPGINAFQPQLPLYDYGNQWYQLAAGDVNGDGKDEVAGRTHSVTSAIYYKPAVDESLYDLSR